MTSEKSTNHLCDLSQLGHKDIDSNVKKGKKLAMPFSHDNFLYRLRERYIEDVHFSSEKSIGARTTGIGTYDEK